MGRSGRSSTDQRGSKLLAAAAARIWYDPERGCSASGSRPRSAGHLIAGVVAPRRRGGRCAAADGHPDGHCGRGAALAVQSRSPRAPRDSWR
jgi:hypothetical protein